MRYYLEYDEGWADITWYVIDAQHGGAVGNAYMNKYSAQTECDRLNELEEG